MIRDVMNQKETGCPAHGSGKILNEASRFWESLYGEELETIRIERIIVGLFCTGVKT
jgi:hypothetical protein